MPSMMRSLLAACLLLPIVALAGDTAHVRRDAPLYQAPSYSAPRLLVLKKGTPLEILARKGGWYRVRLRDGTHEGWMRMLSIRLGSVERRQGASGIAALASFVRSGSRGTVVATGVRGLTEEDIRKARPDLKELKRMEGHRATADEARAFAAEVGLTASDIAWLSPPASTTTQTDEEEEELF